MRYKQAIVFGHGRSGTNWLSRVLDFSYKTHCRVEPNELIGNPLGSLPSPWVVGEENESLVESWDEALSWIQAHVGVRDWPITTEKSFLSPISRYFGIYRLFSGKKYRVVLSLFIPRLRYEEFVMPSFVFDSQELDGALLVMKINQAPEWADWVLRNRHDTSVIQIVRHPGGVLNSWRNRYLSGKDIECVLKSNHERLRAIADIDDEWAELFGSIQDMQLAESELWFWRYSTEMVHRAGKSNDAYILCLFEDLAKQPSKIAGNIYHHLGLEWNHKIEERIINESGDSNDIAQKWRNLLDFDEVEAVEKVLDGSIMKQWWDDL